jgi:hypothetical protein
MVCNKYTHSQAKVNRQLTIPAADVTIATWQEGIMTRWTLAASSVFVSLILLGLFSSTIIAAPVGANAPTGLRPVELTPLPPVENPDGRAGACYSYYHDPHPDRPFIQMAYNAGSRWDRFDFVWPNFEPSEGAWDSQVINGYDTLVNDLHGAGMNIVGILLWTPDWAATGGTHRLEKVSINYRPPGRYSSLAPPWRDLMAPPGASPAPPQGLYEEWDDWTAGDGDPINYWGRFVYTIVSHYRDRVKHWEMWNEPEWDYFWTGTSTDYAQLLKVGYQATNAACPDCTVLFGGVFYWGNPSHYRWVLNILNRDPAAPQNNYFFDVMSVHLYSRASDVYEKVNEIRDGMTVYNVDDHPIWLTETGVQMWDDASVDPDPAKYDWAATQEEAAAYVIQSYANSWASGVEKYFFFRTHDADMGEYFGLIRNDHSLRPAYVAYQIAASYMVSPTLTTRQAYPDGTRQVTLWGTPRGKLSTLWNATPLSLTFAYSATLPTATLVDRRGVTRTITATKGVYTLTLPGATANLVSHPNEYIIGGDPYLIIETDTTPPSATVQTLLTSTNSYTIPISWKGSDDAAGVWGLDVQVQKGTGNTWSDWLHFTETAKITTTSYVAADGQHGETYCFRARAWDKIGNYGEWFTDSQACATLDFREREVHFKLNAIFGDEDSDNVWDTEEITLTETTLRFAGADGDDVVSPTVSSSWEFTTTLIAGDYTFIVQQEGWLPGRIPVAIEPGMTVQEIALENIGLLPHRASTFLPFISRGKGSRE